MHKAGFYHYFRAFLRERPLDISFLFNFLSLQWVGRWYFVASSRHEAPNIDAPTMLTRVGENGNMESFFTHFQ